MKSIVSEAKKFIKSVRSSMKEEYRDDIFVVSIKGTENGADAVSVALYTSVKVGTLSKNSFPNVYKGADALLSLAMSQYSGINGVIIMLTDEAETEVFVHGNALRICNLDA